MVQILPTKPNFAARLGQGLSQGLVDYVPKEMDRQRLSSGLKALSQKKDLSPFEQFAELSSIPGATPQMIQSGTELLRQQAKGNALKSQAGESNDQPSPFPKRERPRPTEKKSATTETRSALDATLENQIPLGLEERQMKAGELMQENPALYPDPQSALAAVDRDEDIKLQQNTALQNRRLNEQTVQSGIISGLANQQEKLKALKVPGNVYSDVEDKAINAVKPISKGGEGLTEQESKKKYGKELDNIARQYQSIDTIGSAFYMLRDTKDIRRTLDETREGFKERDDLENYADMLVSKNKLSPEKAAVLAYKSSEIKDLNNTLSKMPEINRKKIMSGDEKLTFQGVEDKVNNMTRQAVEKLAKSMGKEGSILAIGEELKAKGYNPDVWFEYIGKNRKKLDLSERQGRELEKPRSQIPTLNDFWLFLSSGLDKLVEQE